MKRWCARCGGDHVKDYIGPAWCWTTGIQCRSEYVWASPRGAQAIILAAKVLASARPLYVSLMMCEVLAPADAAPAYSQWGQAEGLSTDAIIKRVVDATAKRPMV